MKVLPNIVSLNCSLNRVGKTAFSVMSSMTRVSSKLLDKKKQFGLEKEDFMLMSVSFSPV